MDKLHLRKPTLGKAASRIGQHAGYIRQSETGAVPEEPAERTACKISQAYVGLSRRFSYATFPARDRHRRNTELTTKVSLTELTGETNSLDLERPFRKNNSNFWRHGQHRSLCAV